MSSTAVHEDRAGGLSILSAAPRVAATALLAAGSVQIVSTLLLLLLGWDETSSADWAAWGVFVAIWSLGWLPALRRLRPWVHVVAGCYLVAVPLIIASRIGPGWVLVATVSFATAVTGIFALPALPALCVVLAMAGLDALVTVQAPPAAAYLVGAPLAGYAGALLDITAGIGLIVAWGAWRRLAERADADYEQVRRAEEQERRDLEIAQAHAAVDRRVHETVLNTLAAIALGGAASGHAGAREAAGHDLAQLESGLALLPDSTVSDVVRAAIQGVADEHLSYSLDLCEDKVSAPVANALRDAVAECLRNVARHSGTKGAHIGAERRGDMLEVSVRDEGVGMPANVQERFGLRNTMRSGIASVGGTVQISTSSGFGTEVTVHIPLIQAPVVREPVFATTRVIDDSLAGRLGLLATPIFLLIATWTFSSVSPGRLPFLLTLVALPFIAIALAFAWNSKARAWLAWFALIGATFALLELSGIGLGCSESGTVAWIIYSVSGGGALLTMLAFRTWQARIAVIVLINGAAAMLVMSLPSVCAPFPWVATITDVGYMLAVLSMLYWADSRFDAERARSIDVWSALVDQRVVRTRQEAIAARWSELDVSVRDFLSGVASGDLDPDEPAVRARAAHEANAIRARLAQGAGPGVAQHEGIRVLLAAAEKCGTQIDVDVISSGSRSERLPDVVLDMLVAVIRAVPGSSIRLTELIDDGFEELIAVVPAEALADAGVDLGVHELGSCTVDIDLGDGLGHISIRRPIAVEEPPE